MDLEPVDSTTSAAMATASAAAAAAVANVPIDTETSNTAAPVAGNASAQFCSVLPSDHDGSAC